MSLHAHSHAQAPTAITPQDHFALRLPSDPQISPDGRHVAYVRTWADAEADTWRSTLCVVERPSKRLHELGPGGRACWSPDGRTLAFARADGGRFFIDSWQAGTGQRAVLAETAQEPSGLAWSPDGTQIAFVQLVPGTAPSPLADDPPDWAALRTPQWAPAGRYTEQLVRRIEGLDGELPAGHHHIFLLDLATGNARQFTHGPFDHGGPRVDVTKMALGGRISWTPDGRHIVMSMQRAAPVAGPLDPAATIAADVHEFDVANGRVRPLTAFGGPVCQATVSPDGRWIAFVGFRNQRKSFHTNELHVMPRDGGAARTLPHPQRMELSQLIRWLPDSSGLLALVPDAGDGCLVRVGLDGEWTTLARDVGGSAASGYVMYQKGYSVADDGSVAYLQGDAARTDEVAVLPAGGGAPQVLTNESAWLHGRRVAPVASTWLPIDRPGATRPSWQAWLLRPPGVPADEPLPLIVWLHGGPYLAWSPHFAMLPQVWAARGWAVLMMNPRGSLGYGEAFTDELQHDFPGAGDLGILDAVEAAIARGGIDPARVHLAGESAGGVLTGWLIGHSTRFASASVVYGVLDWTSQVLTVDRPDYFPYYWLPGAPWEPGMQAEYWRRSPLSLVAQVRTPTLVLCGERDWRTPVSQSELYYTALKLCGVAAALVRYPDDNHSLEWHPSHWLDLIEQMDRWVRRHDPATARAPAARTASTADTR